MRESSRTFLCLRRGVSSVRVHSQPESRFSLPTQRCFRERQGSGPFYLLFSAYAEVFLVAFKLKLFFYSFLCLRRGVSRKEFTRSREKIFSLPTQRCFPLSILYKFFHQLFSAYAEVFLSHLSAVAISLPFLCLRRGVSKNIDFFAYGYPLFSAYAEVFLADDTDSSDLQNFSLPTQRCFSVDGASVSFDTLFSAYAEVFPPEPHGSGNRESFLCLRRGVSKGLLKAQGLADFSLPTQRCFP